MFEYSKNTFQGLTWGGLFLTESCYRNDNSKARLRTEIYKIYKKKSLYSTSQEAKL